MTYRWLCSGVWIIRILSHHTCAKTAVRLAGILLEEFEPFVNVTVPTIISFIEAEDEVDIALIDEETGASSAGDGNYPNGAAAKVKTDMVYKRGEGHDEGDS